MACAKHGQAFSIKTPSPPLIEGAGVPSAVKELIGDGVGPVYVKDGSELVPMAFVKGAEDGLGCSPAATVVEHD